MEKIEKNVNIIDRKIKDIDVNIKNIDNKFGRFIELFEGQNKQSCSSFDRKAADHN